MVSRTSVIDRSSSASDKVPGVLGCASQAEEDDDADEAVVDDMLLAYLAEQLGLPRRSVVRALVAAEVMNKQGGGADTRKQSVLDGNFAVRSLFASRGDAAPPEELDLRLLVVGELEGEAAACGRMRAGSNVSSCSAGTWMEVA